MGRESTQHKLDRVRSPRVQITYDVEIGGAIELKELPFVVGVLGDRFILRSYSPQITIGGGVILDPFPPKHRVRDISAARARLETLSQGDRAQQVAAFVASADQHGLRRADLGARTAWRDAIPCSRLAKP